MSLKSFTRTQRTKGILNIHCFPGSEGSSKLQHGQILPVRFKIAIIPLLEKLLGTFSIMMGIVHKYFHTLQDIHLIS